MSDDAVDASRGSIDAPSPTGSSVWAFDTNIVTTALYPGYDHHQAVRVFCADRVHEAVRVVYSELLRIEYAHHLRTMVGQLSPPELRLLGLHRWEREDVRRRWIHNGFQRFEQFISQFADVDELVVTRDTIDYAAELMIVCNLGSYDAIHVATALVAGATRIVTLDRQFARARSVIDVHLIPDDSA